MAQTMELTAERRDRAGKGAARAARREDKVPAVIYGDKKEPALIKVQKREVTKLWNTGNFMSTLLELDVEGEKTRVIARDVQLDPVRDWVIHVDFLRLGKGSRINVMIPVHFINEEASPGIDKKKGVLNVVRHEVELKVPASDIPEELVIDLTGKDIGDSIHISHVDLPAGAQPTITDRDFTIATIAAPTIAVADDNEGESEEGGEEAAAEEGGEE
jgi:large subunit ribosomal protein L25